MRQLYVFALLFMIPVMIPGVISAEQPEQPEQTKQEEQLKQEKQEERRNWIAVVSTDIFTYQMTMDYYERLFDNIQFGGNMHSLSSTSDVPFAEWVQVLFGYKLTATLYLTTAVALGVNSFYYYDHNDSAGSFDIEDAGDGRTHVVVFVLAPGLSYHLPISETVSLPLGILIGYKGGFFPRKHYKYHAAQVSLSSSIQFSITDFFSLGPGILFDFEVGTEYSYGYEGQDLNGWIGGKLRLSFKTGLDFSLSFYF
ncbi:MAG TPA: hypothetical protein P5077_03390 [bacterium]|nr:hypothetical protein [bacterium]